MSEFTVDHSRPTKPNFYRVWVIIALGLPLMMFLYWKKDFQDIPALDRLAILDARNLEFKAWRMPKGSRNYGAEFKDSSGIRYEMPILAPETLDVIDDALEKKIPVYLRYGKLDSLAESDSAYTVYQIETKDSVIIPYERAAQKKKMLQEGMIPMGICFVVLVVSVGFLAQRNFKKKYSLQGY